MPEDTTERWLPVVGWEGVYEVSDLGRVRSLRTGSILNPTRPRNGRSGSSSCAGSGRRGTVMASCPAFLGHPRAEVDHDDGVGSTRPRQSGVRPPDETSAGPGRWPHPSPPGSSGRRLADREYVTPSGQMQHAVRSGLASPYRGPVHLSEVLHGRVGTHLPCPLAEPQEGRGRDGAERARQTDRADVTVSAHHATGDWTQHAVADRRSRRDWPPLRDRTWQHARYRSACAPAGYGPSAPERLRWSSAGEPRGPLAEAAWIRGATRPP